MLSHAVFRFDNTYQVWKPITAQDPVTGTTSTTYVLDKSGTGLIVPGAQGAVYLSTRENLPLRSALREVKDKNGVHLFQVNGQAYDMYILSVTPQYDAFGSVVGWKHLLKNQIPKTRADLYDEYRSLND